MAFSSETWDVDNDDVKGLEYAEGDSEVDVQC